MLQAIKQWLQNTTVITNCLTLGIKWNLKKILNPRRGHVMACFGLNAFPQNSYTEIAMPKWGHWEAGPLGGD